MSTELDNGRVTTILERIGRGEREAAAKLFTLVYDELRRKAHSLMGAERADHTLQSTALVNEAFVKMAGGRAGNWESSRHFYNAAADAMRKILVDHARRKSADKRGGERARVSLEAVVERAGTEPGGARAGAVDLQSLDDALVKLQRLDDRRYRVVMYRYFAGLQEREIARLLGVTTKTVQRDWKLARVFLSTEMVGEPESTAGRECGDVNGSGA